MGIIIIKREHLYSDEDFDGEIDIVSTYINDTIETKYYWALSAISDISGDKITDEIKYIIEIPEGLTILELYKDNEGSREALDYKLLKSNGSTRIYEVMMDNPLSPNNREIEINAVYKYNDAIIPLDNTGEPIDWSTRNGVIYKPLSGVTYMPTELDDTYDVNDDGFIEKPSSSDEITPNKTHVDMLMSRGYRLLTPSALFIYNKNSTDGGLNYEFDNRSLRAGFDNHVKTYVLNNSDIEYSDMFVVTTIPRVGDDKLDGSEDRGSTINPRLKSEVNAPDGWTVEYTLNEHVDGTNVSELDGWVTADQITDFTKVKVIRYRSNPGVKLQKGQSVEFPFVLSVPTDAEPASRIVSTSAIKTNRGGQYLEGYRTVSEVIKPTGAVVVRYEDVDGKKIKDDVRLMPSTTYVDTPYDAASLKLDAISRDEINYNFDRLKETSEPEKGVVTEGIKYITFVYRQGKKPVTEEVKGYVVVKYVDTEGRELLTEYSTDEVVVRRDTYRENATGEREKISSEDTNATYNVENKKHPTVTDQEVVYNFKEVKDSKPLSGTLAEGETVITLVYEQANVTKNVYGRIVYDIVNEYGDVLAKDVTLDDVLVETIVESSTGEVISRTKHHPQYDYTLPEGEVTHNYVREFPPVKKPAKFDESIDYTKDRQYGNWDGPTPLEQPELFTMKEPYTGEIHEGDNHLTFVVTYPGYDGSLRRNVKVNFVNEKGETIKDSVVTDYKEVAYLRCTIGEGTSMVLIRPYNKNEQYDVSSNAVDFEVDSKRYTYLNEKDNVGLSGALGLAWDEYNADREYVDPKTVYKNFSYNRTDAPNIYSAAQVENIENHDFGQANMFTGYHAEDTLELTLVFREEVLPTETREETGRVIVRYVDRNGNTLQSDFTGLPIVVNRIEERDNGQGGKEVVSTTPTNVTYTVDEQTGQLTEIVKDNIRYTFEEVKDATPLTGTLPVGDKVITLIYDKTPTTTRQEMGKVVVRYVTENGQSIKDNFVGEDQLVETVEEQPMADGSKTVVNRTNHHVMYDVMNEKLNEIEFDGKVYRYVRHEGEALTGELEVGLNEITFVYDVVKGDVEVKYVDINGTEIKDKVVTHDNQPIKSDYDVNAQKMDEVEFNGKVYRYVRTEGESTGKVKEETTVVTYVYDVVKGDVEVKYVDINGIEIKDKVVTHDDQPIKSDYDVNAQKMDEIEFNGRVYRYVRIDGEPTGKVKEETTVVTYVYDVIKGDVEVRYVDINGTEIKDKMVTYDDQPIKSDYDANAQKMDEIEFNGKVYRYVRTDGEPTGKVKEETTVVIYVYDVVSLTSDVEVRYVGPNGEVLKGTILAIDNDVINSGYDVSEFKVPEIEVDGKVYRIRKVEGNEFGIVTSDKTVVTYIYDIVGGSVDVAFKTVDGKELKSTVNAYVNTPVKSQYDVESHGLSELTISGKTYRLVRIDGNVKGIIVEKPTVVTYIYEEIKEDESVDVLETIEKVPNDYPTVDKVDSDILENMVDVLETIEKVPTNYPTVEESIATVENDELVEIPELLDTTPTGEVNESVQQSLPNTGESDQLISIAAMLTASALGGLIVGRRRRLNK